MDENGIVNGNCWVSCFDILGFGERVNELKEHPDVFVEVYYRNILRKSISLCNSNNEVLSKVHFLWFSDTFIFVTEDDSFGSYVSVNQLSRRFFDTQIISGLPLQGALSVGQIYYSKNENIIVGTSLIDAYIYASGQNWIGFILTPSTDEKLKELNNHPDRGKFVRYDVPFENRKPEKLFAYNMSRHSNRENILLRAIKDMHKQAETQNSSYKIKYDNTLRFIDEINSKKVSDGK
jgi:hypothetical protein